MGIPKNKCNKCDKYQKTGHNYCRMCGYHLTKGYVQYVKLALAYNTNEKFCGHCGKLRNDCEC